MDVVQDREEDYKQLFVKVDLSLFVHGTQINGIAVLNDCWSCSYRAIPIYLVESCMDIAEYVEKEILVVLVELYQWQQNVKEGIAQTFTSIANLGYFPVIDDACLVSLVVMEYYYSTIYPYGKLIDEILLRLS